MAINWILERVEESTSTNEDLMSRWRAGLLWEPVARMALKQTSGRGRMGRAWVSGPDTALTFSVAYPFKKGIQDLSGLSLACGLAVVKGIASATNTSKEDLQKMGLGLKWPNDILLNQKKLAGMLIEGGRLKTEEPTWLIIGIGINLNSNSNISAQIGREIAGVNDLAISTPINADLLWLELLKELGAVIVDFENSSFKKFQTEWNDWDVYKNKMCQIHQQDKLELEGTAKGVDENGCLLIESSGTLKKIISGDVSLRIAE